MAELSLYLSLAKLFTHILNKVILLLALPLSALHIVCNEGITIIIIISVYLWIVKLHYNYNYNIKFSRLYKIIPMLSVSL